jgi:hypothetical protein
MGKRKAKDPLDAIIDYAMTADPAELKAAAVAFNRIVLRRTQPQNGTTPAQPRQRRTPNKPDPPVVANETVAGYKETYLADGGK